MRYLPLTAADRRAMLAAIGLDSTDALFTDVPPDARLPGPIAGLSNHQSELEVERYFRGLADKNKPAGSGPFFIGAGAYRHHVPASVDHLIQRGEFLTSYTPYQPEVSQGTLQYLFEFQTQVALLTGMDVANASMYDGSTAAAEAVMMAGRITGRNKSLLASGLHPHYADVVATVGRYTGFGVEQMPTSLQAMDGLLDKIDDSLASVVVQTPDVFGQIHDVTQLAEKCHQHGVLLIVVVTEIMSLGLLTPPGAMGADIVVAEGQSIGNGLNFGGPYVGLFATRDKYVRQMPGRLCGETVDADGQRGFVLTLSTREQHIRREKATSNICTNSGLCALAFTIHLSLLGEEGLKQTALLNHARAVQLADAMEAIGLQLVPNAFFNEFTLRLPYDAAPLVEKLAAHNIHAGVPLSRLFPEQPEYRNLLLLAATELTTESDIAALQRAIKEYQP